MASGGPGPTFSIKLQLPRFKMTNLSLASTPIGLCFSLASLLASPQPVGFLSSTYGSAGISSLMSGEKSGLTALMVYRLSVVVTIT